MTVHEITTEKYIAGVICYISLYFITVFGWVLQRNMLYFLLILYLLTNAYHNIETSNFYKFLAELHSVFKEVEKYLIDISWRK